MEARSLLEYRHSQRSRNVRTVRGYPHQTRERRGLHPQGDRERRRFAQGAGLQAVRRAGGPEGQDQGSALRGLRRREGLRRPPADRALQEVRRRGGAAARLARAPQLEARRALGGPGAFLALLPAGAAEALSARGAVGVLQRVLAQARLDGNAQGLRESARREGEARDDRVGLERTALGEPGTDEVRRGLAVVEITAIPRPHQRALVGSDAVAQLELGQIALRLAHEQVEVVVVEPAPRARRIVLGHIEYLSQHGPAPCPVTDSQ